MFIVLRTPKVFSLRRSDIFARSDANAHGTPKGMLQISSLPRYKHFTPLE